MKQNKLYLKLSDLFKNCSPLYSNLILFILIIIGIFIRLKYDNFENTKNNIFLLSGLFLIHFSFVFFLCKKNFKKIAYLIAYLPFIYFIGKAIIIIHDVNDLFMKVIEKDDDINQNNSNNQVQS